MKALIKKYPGETDLEIVDIPRPVCPDDGVVLKIRTAGICGSDIHYYKWTEKMPLPLLMGHEFCGDIAELGKNVRGWKVGDFVISAVPCYPCGMCASCRDGHPEQCSSKIIAGLTGPGAFTEYFVTYPQWLFPVPAGISEEEAACAEPLSIVVHALKRFSVRPQDRVVVLGMGIIGLLTIQVLHITGVREILAVGVDSDEPVRMPLAKKYGAARCFNGQHHPASEQILAYTDGHKADLVIDCTGVVPAIEDGFRVVKKLGTLAAIGVPPTDSRVALNWNHMVWNSINILSSFGADEEDWPDVIDLLASGRLHFRDAITQVIRMEDWASVFKAASNPNHVKAVIKMDG